MCANFTAFDQKIFNCQFANEVDCDNSPLFYDRSVIDVTLAHIFIYNLNFSFRFLV